MAKKSKSRRDSRPRLSEAQLQAYRARQAAAASAAPASEPSSAPDTSQPVVYSRWGRVDEEYAIIRADLTRLLILTAGMLAILVILWFILG